MTILDAVVSLVSKTRQRLIDALRRHAPSQGQGISSPASSPVDAPGSGREGEHR